MQPYQHALHARALLGQVFRLLLVARQLQSLGFFGQQVRQPFAQLGGTLAIATGVAALGPAALQQPEGRLERQQAPAGLTQFFGELRRCGLAHPLIVLTGFDSRTPVLDQHIEQFAQLSAAGTWGGLAEAAEQGAQFDELLQPFAQQLPAAIEAVLLGQSLAIAEQLPAKRDDGIVQRHARCQFRCGQLQAVAIGVIQAVAAFGLADVAGHQRQVGGQFGGQFQQRFGLALAQFQLQLADLLGLLAGLDLAQVQRGFDDDPGLSAAPGDLGLLADEIGGEDRFQGLLVQVGEAGRPAVIAKLLDVQLGLVQVPVPLVAFGQAGDALAAAFQGLDELLAVAPQAQRHAGMSQFALGGVVILVEQLMARPAALVALLQQRMFAQGEQSLAAGA